MPDFQQLDRAIAQLSVGGGGGGRAGTMSPMESVPEEQQLLDTEVAGAGAEAAEAPGSLNDSLLEELGIFNDYDAYKTARTGLSAGGSGTSSEEGSDDSSGDDQPAPPQPQVPDDPVPLAVPFIIPAVDKKNDSEDSDPERPRRRSSS